MLCISDFFGICSDGTRFRVERRFDRGGSAVSGTSSLTGIDRECSRLSTDDIVGRMAVRSSLMARMSSSEEDGVIVENSDKS